MVPRERSAGVVGQRCHGPPERQPLSVPRTSHTWSCAARSRFRPGCGCDIRSYRDRAPADAWMTVRSRLRYATSTPASGAGRGVPSATSGDRHSAMALDEVDSTVDSGRAHPRRRVSSARCTSASVVCRKSCRRRRPRRRKAVHAGRAPRQGPPPNSGSSVARPPERRRRCCGGLTPARPDSGTHRGTSREPVVDEDDGAGGNPGRRPVASVLPLTPSQLGELLRGQLIDRRDRDAELPNDGLVQTRTPPLASAPSPAPAARERRACARPGRPTVRPTRPRPRRRPAHRRVAAPARRDPGAGGGQRNVLRAHALPEHGPRTVATGDLLCTSLGRRSGLSPRHVRLTHKIGTMPRGVPDRPSCCAAKGQNAVTGPGSRGSSRHRTRGRRGPTPAHGRTPGLP